MPDADTPTDRPRKRTWLRRVRTVVLCLIAGAIINVLVVIGLSATIDIHSPEMTYVYGYPLMADDGTVMVSGKKRLGSVYVQIHGWTEWQPSDLARRAEIESYWASLDDTPGWLRVNGVPDFITTFRQQQVQGVDVHQRSYEARGLPLVSFYCEKGWPNGEIQGGIALPLPKWAGRFGNAPRLLPTIPNWTGIVLNSLFWGAVVMAIPLATIGVRARRRSRRGLCPACAYDLRGAKHDVCPECGK